MNPRIVVALKERVKKWDGSEYSEYTGSFTYEGKMFVFSLRGDDKGIPSVQDKRNPDSNVVFASVVAVEHSRRGGFSRRGGSSSGRYKGGFR